MKSFARAFVALSLVAAASAYAEPNTEPSLTRAEVLADLRITRSRGCTSLTRRKPRP